MVDVSINNLSCVLQAGSQFSRPLLGCSLQEWRERTRRELGLPVDRPIIATGHQPLLWHPGILAKYMARTVAAQQCGFAQANLIVDQDVGEFTTFDAPVRVATGSLGVIRVKLAATQPGVPVGLHPPFEPKLPPDDTLFALESVRSGVKKIAEAIRARSDAPNAAMQVSCALTDLMRRWVEPTPDVTASALGRTGLACALMQHIVKEPMRCAEAYNRAVAAVPDAEIPLLAIHSDDIETPIWKIGPGQVRIRATVSDIERALNEGASSPDRFLPRALFMTALARLGMCDLFIHGTGGEVYDKAMEMWIRDWLGVDVAPIAVVTADLRLPLLNDGPPPNVERLIHAARHLWHDPKRDSSAALSAEKRAMLEEIERLPRNSSERRQAYYSMHKRLEAAREQRLHEIDSVDERIADASRRMADATIAARRDWAFPLYPDAMIDELSAVIRAHVPLLTARRV